MKKIFISVIIFMFSIDLFPNDINYEVLSLSIQNININFSHFPTENIWNRNQCTPILDTQIKRNYRTIITNASKLEPNFDGKYRIVEFGYGTSTQYFFIIDLNNGNVYEGLPSTHRIKYSLNSSLIIINDPEIILEIWNNWDGDIPNWVIIEYILWENNSFYKLLTINPFIEN